MSKIFNIVKFDIGQFATGRLDERVASLASFPMTQFAAGVETKAQAQWCKEMKFGLSQGYYFAEPEAVGNTQLSATQTNLIRLINLVGREEVDVFEIEKSMKREPALAVSLLNIVNSVGFGLSRRLSSLHHAITMLGRRYLQRWLQLLLMLPAGKNDVHRGALLQMAVLRGRMMELLVRRKFSRDSKLADQAFITGIMSLMPAALGMPMDKISELIPLEPEVMQALACRGGVLGKTLALVEKFDAQDAEGCEMMIGQLSELRLEKRHLNLCLVDALCWMSGNISEP